MSNKLGWTFWTAWVLTVPLAAYLVRFIVPMGFGYMAPAAVLVVGVALALRDGVQDRLGSQAVLLGIGLGAILAAFINANVALASAVAYLVSESLDWAVYTPLRKRQLYMAVAVSNLVGLVVDSVIFLRLATALGPDRMAFIPGQVLGKVYATVFALGVLWVIQRRRKKVLAPATT